MFLKAHEDKNPPSDPEWVLDFPHFRPRRADDRIECRRCAQEQPPSWTSSTQNSPCSLPWEMIFIKALSRLLVCSPTSGEFSSNAISRTSCSFGLDVKRCALDISIVAITSRSLLLADPDLLAMSSTATSTLTRSRRATALLISAFDPKKPINVGWTDLQLAGDVGDARLLKPEVREKTLRDIKDISIGILRREDVSHSRLHNDVTDEIA